MLCISSFDSDQLQMNLRERKELWKGRQSAGYLQFRWVLPVSYTHLSGESELLLVELKDNVLSYQNTMQFHLDNMLRDRVIGSIPQFFETLFRVCANKDSLQQISNIFGQKTVKHVSMEFVLSNVPSGLRKLFTEEK